MFVRVRERHTDTEKQRARAKRRKGEIMCVRETLTEKELTKPDATIVLSTFNATFVSGAKKTTRGEKINKHIWALVKPSNTQIPQTPSPADGKVWSWCPVVASSTTVLLFLTGTTITPS